MGIGIKSKSLNKIICICAIVAILLSQLPSGGVETGIGNSGYSDSEQESSSDGSSTGFNTPPIAIIEPRYHKVIDIGENIAFDGSSSIDPDGTLIYANWSCTKEKWWDNGTWSENQVANHTFDTVGIFELTLTVTDNSSITDSDRCRVYVLDRYEHPRLFFTNSTLQSYRDKSRSLKTGWIWNNILSWAEDEIYLADSPPPDPPDDEGGLDNHYANWKTMNNVTNHLWAWCLAYAVEGNELYAYAARNWTISVCNWNQWGDNGTGSHVGGDGTRRDKYATAESGLYGVSFAFDVLYDYLSNTDRATINASLAYHTETLWRDTAKWRDNVSNTSGTRSDNVFNCVSGISALALLGDHSYESSMTKIVDYVFNRTQLYYHEGNYAHWGSDGSFDEGYGYSGTELEPLVRWYSCMKNVLNEDMWNSSISIQRYSDWMKYIYVPQVRTDRPQVIMYEDGAGYVDDDRFVIPAFASIYNDSEMQWIFNETQVPGYESGNRTPQPVWYGGNFAKTYGHHTMYNDVWDFYFYNPDIQIQKPEELYSKKFEGDYTIFRTGFDDNDTLFMIKGGHSYVHSHCDQTNIYLSTLGLDRWLDFYGGYLYYAEDYTYKHNVITVNDLGQGKTTNWKNGPWYRGKFPDYITNNMTYDYVLVNATQAWKNRLTKCLRHVVFMRPEYFVVLDEVENSSPSNWDWYLHAYYDFQFFINPTTNRIIINRSTLYTDRGNVTIQLFEPTTYSHHIDNNYVEGLTPMIRITPPDSTSQKFLWVIYPLSTTVPGYPSELPSMNKISTGNIIGVKVNRTGVQDRILFNTSGYGINYENIITDGNRCSLSNKSDGNVQMFAMHNGTSFVFNECTLISSDRISSAAFSYNNGSGEGTVQLNSPGIASIYFWGDPRVFINDVELSSDEYSYNKNTCLVILNLTAGTSNIEFIIEGLDIVNITNPEPPFVWIDEDAVYSHDFEYYDSYGHSVNWNVETNASWIAEIDSNGLLVGTPTNPDVGCYWVNVSCDDGKFGNEDWNNYTLVVNNTNDDPVISNPEPPFVWIDEDATYSHRFYYADDDGDVAVWSSEANASWLAEIASDGLLVGTPTNADIGCYWVNVSCDDGKFGNEDWNNYTLVVNNTNDDPVISNPEPPFVWIDEGAIYSHRFYYADDDDDVAVWSSETNASWLGSINFNGVLLGTPVNTHAGHYRMNVSCSDEYGGVDWNNYTLVVNDTSSNTNLLREGTFFAYLFFSFSMIGIIAAVYILKRKKAQKKINSKKV